MIRIWWSCLASLVSLFVVLSVVSAWDDQPRRFGFTEKHMGTAFRIVLYAKDEAQAQSAATKAFQKIAALDLIMSDYNPSSELMQLCKKAGGPPVAVSPDLAEVLKQSEWIAKLSDGVFDVSIGPVVKLWRRARRTRQMPSREELDAALKLVDYRKIELSPDGRMVRLVLAGMLLDLGGIAKGYAAQAALELLRELGFRQALVAAGGDVTVGDAPPDANAWKVGIAPLKNPEATPTHYLALVNASVSTAGDAEQVAVIDEKRYSHIVDPRTGIGLTGRRSVSVIARNGTQADALDTAACILGPEKGIALVERVPGAAAIFVYETDAGEREVVSKSFDQYRWR